MRGPERRGVMLSPGRGLFNPIEGRIDRELLGIHHVVEAGDHLLWGMALLAPASS